MKDQDSTPAQQFTCTDCGVAINEGEAKTFGVCDPCWDKHVEKAGPPSTPAQGAKPTEGLEIALAKKIKLFEAYKSNPAFGSEMEQNAIAVTLRELNDLSQYASLAEVEALKAEVKRLKGL